MSKFVISPHFRLHEWVAEEKGYFKAEGLDYQFRGVWKTHNTPDRSGAFQNIEKGLEANVSCACHWTVNVAASKGHGKLYADAYSVAPAAVNVNPVRFLNHEVAPFDHVIPTVENIAVEIWRRLAEAIPQGAARLYSVRVYETSDLYVEYFGQS